MIGVVGLGVRVLSICFGATSTTSSVQEGEYAYPNVERWYESLGEEGGETIVISTIHYEEYL